MNTKKNVFKDSLVIGFAMFAVFFGAGNLVFPPQIGLVSGSSVFPAIIGLTLSGILFPMLAVAAVGNVGTNLEDICRHAHAKLHLAFMAVASPGVVFGTIPKMRRRRLRNRALRHLPFDSVHSRKMGISAGLLRHLFLARQQ